MAKIRELEKIGEFSIKRALASVRAPAYLLDKTDTELFDLGCNISRIYGKLSPSACDEAARALQSAYQTSITHIRAEINSRNGDHK